MLRAVIFVLLSSHFLAGNAFALSCAFRGPCISTQGTKVPSEKVIDMLDLCDDFTSNNVGAVFLRLSLAEILERTKGNPGHPLSGALYAHERLQDSPLRFDRNEARPQVKFNQIKLACSQLIRDFHNDSLWSR